MLCNLIRKKNILVSSLTTLVMIKKIIDKCQPIYHEFDPFGWLLKGNNVQISEW